MSNEEITRHLAGMDDGELRKAVETVKYDLAHAAACEPNSEWHHACFAAAILYAEEVQKRGLIIATMH